MKRKGKQGMALGLAAALLCLGLPVFARGEELAVSARSAVLLSGESGAVLWEKNPRERLPMASTTKIMTALLALEEAERAGDPAVEITEEMVAVEGSSMGLRAGDRLTLANLAAGMLLASGNDAAHGAALFLDGSQEGFARRMNSRAEEIGMKDTHFVTPSGLDAEDHFSTAYDLALLAREALENEAFAELAASPRCEVTFIEPAHTATYENHNKLLGLYEGCVGVKTGYTKKAGRCLVSAARREGVTLIAVTLDAPDDWDDHTALLDYGFSQLEQARLDGSACVVSIPVVGGGADAVEVHGVQGDTFTLPAGDSGRVTVRVMAPRFLYAPVEAGEQVGELQYCLGGRELARVPLVAAAEVPRQEKQPGFWERLWKG